MLDVEQTNLLIRKAKDGDADAKETAFDGEQQFNKKYSQALS